MLICSLIQTPVAFFLRKFSTDEEMEKVFRKPWQKRLVKIIGIISRIQLFFCSIIIKEKGNPATSKDAPIVVGAPHSTFFDAWIAVTMGAWHKDRISPVVAAEYVDGNIIGGSLMNVSSPIKVYRQDGE